MDVNFFLKERTRFVRSFYDQGVAPFRDIQKRIEDKAPPFDDPPCSEDGEPAFLTEWLDAETSADLLSQTCVSLLSDTLKLYFNTLQAEIGFAFDQGDKAFRKGFVGAYRDALGDIFETDWSDCPVRFSVIEQAVLARNLSQHGGHLTSFHMSHDAGTLRRHPQPFFASPEESKAWQDSGGKSSFLTPSVKITRDRLFEAIQEVEQLGDWLDARLIKVHEWRHRPRNADPAPEAEVFGLLAAGRAALDLCRPALDLFEARRSEVIDQGDDKGLVIDGRRLERSVGGPLTAQGLIGAQAFLANLVVVENCLVKLSGLRGLPASIKVEAERAVKTIKGVVDRQVRNTAEHIDDRVVRRADQSLISSSIFEPNLLCSTRADGTIGAVSISEETLAVVTHALDRVIQPPRRAGLASS
ncbi:hypothetical protein [Brevundimonas sp.]|uniref:hypothetical protein n=1 Tax=Brevundimonas sp. TaxID=1871086 RepID=UPI0028A942F6|nr:hypothetical protein [Brevundimonas sp.]